MGLERFEHADIQANLILRVKEVKVDEDINLEIELVNAGKAPALLIKVEEIIPEGFEIKEVPEIYRVEDRYLNMKGKRLNPLKTEEVKIVITPLSKGTFIMKPRILYIDETGKYRSHEPEPATITVKELGITGWIKRKEISCAYRVAQNPQRINMLRTKRTKNRTVDQCSPRLLTKGNF